jgi:hypothetical protein
MRALSLLIALLIGCGGAASDGDAISVDDASMSDTARADALPSEVAADTADTINDATSESATADSTSDAAADASTEVCAPTPSAEACKIPDDFPYPHCGDVPNGCGATMSCGTCTGICARSWDDPKLPAGMCVCADGYDSAKKCLTLSLKAGRWITCYRKVEALYGDAPDCRDVTPPGNPFRVWCCP